ncbi:MAG: transketolase, partial [Chloroflexi bacterium]|nr:transketolase [Chloroflexota bacterium]
VIGGVGTATAEMIAEHGIGKKLVKIGLQDTFIHGASKPYLMREYGLDAIALVEQVEKLISAKLNISENDLAAVRLDAVHSEAKAEAL